MFGTFTYLALFDKLLSGQSALECFGHEHDVFTIITTCGVIVILVISFPLFGWAARLGINQMIWKDKPMTDARWIAIGGFLCMSTAFIASLSDNVIIFFDLSGGMITPVVVLGFPVLFFLIICKDASIWMKGVAVFTGVFMVVGACACTYQAVDEIVNAMKK